VPWSWRHGGDLNRLWLLTWQIQNGFAIGDEASGIDVAAINGPEQQPVGKRLGKCSVLKWQPRGLFGQVQGQSRYLRRAFAGWQLGPVLEAVQKRGATGAGNRGTFVGRSRDEDPQPLVIWRQAADELRGFGIRQAGQLVQALLRQALVHPGLDPPAREPHGHRHARQHGQHKKPGSTGIAFHSSALHDAVMLTDDMRIVVNSGVRSRAAGGGANTNPTRQRGNCREFLWVTEYLACASG